MVEYDRERLEKVTCDMLSLRADKYWLETSLILTISCPWRKIFKLKTKMLATLAHLINIASSLSAKVNCKIASSSSRLFRVSVGLVVVFFGNDYLMGLYQ